MFFVLSGRLLADMLFVRQMPVGLFLRRRVSRIIPTLIVFTSTIWLLTIILPKMGVALNNFVGWRDFLAGNLFFENYLWPFGPAANFHHLWSLAVEEHCYFIAAALAIFWAKDATRAAWIALALATAALINGLIQVYFRDGHGGYDVYWRTDVRGASILFAFGMYLLLRTNSPKGVLWALAAPASFAAAVAISLLVLPEYIRWSIGPICLAISMATLDWTFPWIKRALAFPPFIWAGLVSYSVYLWQEPFYAEKPDLGANLAFAIAIALGLMSFFFIEQPSRRFLNRTWAAARTDRLPIEGPSAGYATTRNAGDIP
jgi:peptidoglycan/LPS O-acetylase OafA/YrhL